ncbi:MAG: hypothetical protein RLP09_11860 [Sandaracinaceae bacterium]
MKHLGTCTVLCALFALGCAGRVVVVDGVEVYEGHWREAREGIESVAAFQFDCPSDALSYRLLRKIGRVVTQVGVAGCGQRDVYTRVGSQWFGSGQQEAAAERHRQVEAARTAAAAQQRPTQ